MSQSALNVLDTASKSSLVRELIRDLPALVLLLDFDGCINCFGAEIVDYLRIYQKELSLGQPIVELFPEFENVSYGNVEHNPQEVEIVVGVQTLHAKVYVAIGVDFHLVVFNRQGNSSLLQLVLDCIPARVFWKDRLGRYLGGNHLFIKDCGAETIEELIGKCDFDYFPELQAKNYIADDREVMVSGRPKLNIEEPQTQPDGRTFWLSTNKVPIRNRLGDIIGIMGSYTDISERKQYEDMIQYQARFDHLTSLRNRFALQESLDNLEAEQIFCGGLLFLDLDHFKTINDSLGHALGDAILQLVAQRIESIVQDQGTVFRLGGDEFSVLVTPPSQRSEQDVLNELLPLAERLREVVIQPYRVQSHYLQLGVSIGVSVYDNINKKSWKDKLEEADIAMYEAKSAGRNKIVTFSEKMRKRVEYVHSLHTKLRTACKNDEVFFLIQPQFSCEHHIIGGEVLLRWNNPELGLVSPAEFIPISEQTGVIFELGDWVLEQAFILVKRWLLSDKYMLRGPLAVNVSPKQFQQADFVDKIENLLHKYRICASLIQLELTESLLLECESAALDKLKALYSLGFTVAIDDFGTGYSCLAYLGKIPFGKLKIDRSFVNNATSNERQAAIIETIISMTKKLDVGLIAEGVETAEQLEYLIGAGCSEFQGYYFSRPISVADYEKLISNDLAASEA